MPRNTTNVKKDANALFLQATKTGDLKEIKNQYTQNIDIEVKDEDGCTALNIAAYNGKLEVVKFLLEKSADPNTQSYLGSMPLHGAAMNGHLEIVQLLLAQVQVKVDATTQSGYTALHKAAVNGHYNIVQFLLATGANPNAKDKNNNPPLFYAILGKHLNIVALLVAKGAHVDIEIEGKSIREYADQTRDGMLADFIESIMDNESIENDNIQAIVLYYAVQQGLIEVVEYLLQQEPTLIHIQDKKEQSLLDIAIENGYYEIVILLLSFNPIAKWDKAICDKWIQNALNSLYSLYDSSDSEASSDEEIENESDVEENVVEDLSDASDTELSPDQADNDTESEELIESELESEGESHHSESDIEDAQSESSDISNLSYYAAAQAIMEATRKKHIQLIALLFAKGYETYTFDSDQCPALKDIDEHDQLIIKDFLKKLEKYDSVKKRATQQFFGYETEYLMLSKDQQDSIAVWLNIDLDLKPEFYRFICNTLWNKLPTDLFLTIIETGLQDAMTKLSRFSLDWHRTSEDKPVVTILSKGLMEQLLLFHKQKYENATQSELQPNLMK